eukprot:2697087-Alexandrium_andersonii.AAC.1
MLVPCQDTLTRMNRVVSTTAAWERLVWHSGPNKVRNRNWLCGRTGAQGSREERGGLDCSDIESRRRPGPSKLRKPRWSEHESRAVEELPADGAKTMAVRVDRAGDNVQAVQPLSWISGTSAGAVRTLPRRRPLFAKN